MKYFLVKETQFRVVRAETESQALEDAACPLHSMHMNGSSFCWFSEAIEAEDIWKARDLFDEKLKMEKR